MKKAMKKAFSLLLAFAMILGLGITAFAAETGTITIDNAVPGQTYKIYKVFDLTYAGSGTSMAVSYTYEKSGTNDALYTALAGDDSPFTLTQADGDNYSVSLKDANTSGEDIAAFLKKLVAAGTLTTSIESQTAPAAAANSTTSTVKFEGLALGYYYVGSTLGTAVGLDSATPTATIKEKNIVPENEKTVSDTEDGSYGSQNSANLGDTVYFKSTIKAYEGAENYVFHDTMTEGLDFNENSVTVTVGTETLLSYSKGGTACDYKLVYPGTDGCTFDIEFSEKYLKTITGTSGNPTEIVISYSATVNSKAVIGDEGNGNSSHLDYGDSTNTKSTPGSTTTTYVYKFGLYKYTGDETNKTELDGAEFKLTRSGEADALYFTTSTKDDKTVYTLAKKTDEGASQTITAGDVTIEGLEANTYSLEETKAPDGYNMLSKPVTVVIGQKEKDNTVSMTLTQDGTTVSQIGVLNKSGNTLPDTGGIGTTIFYVLGTILVVGAAVLLIVRKRMGSTAE